MGEQPNPRGNTNRGQREAVVQEIGVPAPGLAEAIFVGWGEPSGQGRVGGAPGGVIPVGRKAGALDTQGREDRAPQPSMLWSTQLFLGRPGRGV